MQLDYPGESGKLCDHLLKVESASGIRDPLLDSLDIITDDIEYLYVYFWDIRNSIGGSGFGPAPISATELKAWSEITGNKLATWEVNILREMDREYMKYVAEENDKKAKRQKANAAARSNVKHGR